MSARSPETAGNPVEVFVIRAVAVACNLDELTVSLDTSPADIGMDSIGFHTLAARIEDAYDCELASHEILELMTAPLVGDMVKIVAAIVAGSPESRAVR